MWVDPLPLRTGHRSRRSDCIFDFGHSSHTVWDRRGKVSTGPRVDEETSLTSHVRPLEAPPEDPGYPGLLQGLYVTKAGYVEGTSSGEEEAVDPRPRDEVRVVVTTIRGSDVWFPTGLVSHGMSISRHLCPKVTSGGPRLPVRESVLLKLHNPRL